MSSTGQAKDLATIVGANIRHERDRREWTQSELARQIGGKTTNQQVSDWERGVNRPSDATLLMLCQLFNHQFAWWFVDHELDGMAA